MVNPTSEKPPAEKQPAEKPSTGKSSTGLDENVAGLLCYVGWWISGLVFVLIEKSSKLVRFHAMQSIYVFGIISVAEIILSWIPFVGFILSWIVWVIGIVLWIVLMVRAYQGKMLKLPWVGNQAEKWAERKSKA